MRSDHTSLGQFDRELEAAYRSEVYRVRDNGAVCRQRRPGSRKRPLDDLWTFGVHNGSTGYMHIGTEVVHRIVATAFLGEQPSVKHIVDHIDTNRRNNRVENLRWVTKLDNILNNPVTRRRIEIAYGSLEAFFENPRAPVNSDALRNFEWMRTVTKEEAQESRERLERWAASTTAPSGGVIGEWIFGVRNSAEQPEEPVSDVPSLTPNAVQRNWRTPAKFEQCPDACSLGALTEYAVRLKSGLASSVGQLMMWTSGANSTFCPSGAAANLFSAICTNSGACPAFCSIRSMAPGASLIGTIKDPSSCLEGKGVTAPCRKTPLTERGRSERNTAGHPRGGHE